MHDAPHCLNCGSVAPLNYCANCGQETRVHVPSAREFVHEFVTHYIAIEGKLWRTLKLMLFKPGCLTTEYLAGKRASYIIPLRIFLTFSILFFATMKLSNVDLVNSDVGTTRQEQAARANGVTLPGPPPVGSKKAEEARRNGNDLQALVEYIGPGPVAKMKSVLALPEAQRDKVFAAGFYSYAPYAMLLLMPVFAFYLKLLYLGSGRRYGEHFLFALHTNAFAYLQITLMILSPWGFLTFLLGVWLVFYLPTAMRRVYGGSRTVTFVRWLVLAFLHLFSLSVAVLAALVLPMMS